jgi:hypothetical protein
MGAKKRHRREQKAERAKPTIPRPRNLAADFHHVSKLPGYLVPTIKVTIDLLVDRDVPPAVVSGLRQEFRVKSYSPEDCGIDGRDDPRLAREAKKRGLIVLTRNHNDFFSGPMIPIHGCFGIFAVDAQGDRALQTTIANMGAIIRELGPHVQWTWWNKTKLKFGPNGGSLIRHEQGMVRRRLKIDPATGKVWFTTEK